ncbi:RagB/SusD family nutrient uptake outer membrane protein [Parapedobacter defluvii]|uniref:RagB/SusD family nutrient uptake outer membrane protein n=1 Tax=Parapedobacter defluvii TaxID=2045106 RepID=UPI00333ED94C
MTAIVKTLRLYAIACASMGAAALLAAGCSSDALEIEPKDQVSNLTVWSEPTSADLFLNTIYGDIPTLNQWRSWGISAEDPEENYSDNSMNGVDWRYSRTVYATSVYTPSTTISHWPLYTSIRACNIFIENISAIDLDAEWKKTRLAEARFLRAYFYQYLWVRYGSIPVITEVLDRNTQGDSIFRPNNTSDEVFEFIVSELNAIAEDLPLDPEEGRASKGAVLALKGWCELFQASPLKNPTNDVERWSRAAQTYQQIIDLGFYDLFPDYATMFLKENNGNVETIFARKHLANTSLGGIRIIEMHVPYYKEQWAGDGSICPTQDLVDEYAMANGLPITDPDSGYDPQRPYENREQRFYQSIIYNGSVWRDDTVRTYIGSGSKNTLDLASASEATNTGYYLRKGLDARDAQNWRNTGEEDYIIYRFAEVLLAYAEAANEAFGPTDLVYEAINKVRHRSALPDLPKGLDQDAMRTAIHRERRVELAFEEKRWLDLLRLKLAGQKLNGPLHAIRIERANGRFVYTTIPAPGGNRVFDPQKNYVLPIPQSAIDQNPNLVQNSNY